MIMFGSMLQGGTNIIRWNKSNPLHYIPILTMYHSYLTIQYTSNNSQVTQHI